MDRNYNHTNPKKLLLVVKELHQRGYQNLRIIPSLSPSGTHWRCVFINETKENSCTASNWIFDHEKENSREAISLTPQELADLFIRENSDFIESCKGKNEDYAVWFARMVNSLQDDELPYAFADYFSATDHWETSKGNKIKTLANEKDYYF